MRLTVTDNVDSSIETQASSRADLRTAIKVHDDKYYAVNIAYVYYSKAEISNTITAIKALKVNNL